MTAAHARNIYGAAPLPLGAFIRVIRIRPGPAHDPIACDFRLLNLDDGSLCDFKTGRQRGAFAFGTERVPRRPRLQYTALSYTWGDAEPVYTISVDDKQHQVRQNLWEFLRTARKNGLKDFLWIDALCIDQEYLAERNHQVNMMGEIYVQAERVIVWLGAVSERVESAMKELDNNSPRCNAVGYTDYGDWEFHSGVAELYGLAYWSRAWIVQEYVLAKTVTIWSDTLQKDGAILDIGGDPASHKDRKTLPADRVITARNKRICREVIVSKSMVYHTRILDDDDSTMTGLLSMFSQNLHCADPRDRIYSLLSLLDLGERAHLDLTPDYSKSTSDLFACVVRSFRPPWDDAGAVQFRAAVDTLVQMLKLGEGDKEIRKARRIEASRGMIVYTGEEEESGEESEESDRLNEEDQSPREDDERPCIDCLSCNVI